MSWEVLLHPKIKKQLKRFPKKDAERIEASFYQLRINPFAGDMEKMEGALDAPQSQTFQWTFTDKDILHLANSIYHTAITINTESTMTLDAAALDKPVILIGFDGNQKLPYWSSVIRNYDREHLKALLETGGAKLAHNLEELIEYINQYLKNPNMDAYGRELLRDKLLYKFDGNSSKRVVDAVVSML